MPPRRAATKRKDLSPQNMDDKDEVKSDYRARTASSILMETPAQRKARLAYARNRAAQLRATEAPEDREKRLANIREKKAKLQATETEEERRERLNKYRKPMKPSKRAAHLQKCKDNYRARAAAETAEQKALRLAELRAKRAAFLEAEQPEVRQERLAREREKRIAKARSNGLDYKVKVPKEQSLWTVTPDVEKNEPYIDPLESIDVKHEVIEDNVGCSDSARPIEDFALNDSIKQEALPSFSANVVSEDSKVGLVKEQFFSCVWCQDVRSSKFDKADMEVHLLEDHNLTLQEYFEINEFFSREMETETEDVVGRRKLH